MRKAAWLVRVATLAGCVFSLLGCHFRSEADLPGRSYGRPALNYVVPTVSGPPIESNAHRGRVTVLLFVTTFDVFSQAQALRLEDLFRSHRPRINAAAIAMEPPRNVELVRAFGKILNLTYSVGLADQGILSRQGLLGQIHTVPAWVILDARGRLAVTGVGSLSVTELEKGLREAEALSS